MKVGVWVVWIVIGIVFLLNATLDGLGLQSSHLELTRITRSPMIYISNICIMKGYALCIG